MAERLDDGMPRDLQSAAQIIPDRDAEFGACFGEAEERIAAIKDLDPLSLRDNQTPT